MKMVFITWYPSCRRSDALAEAMGGKSYLIHFLRFKQPLYAPFKYIMQAFATWYRLIKTGPDLVIVASPPVIAVLTVWLYCAVFRAKLVVDAHTGVFDDQRWAWALPMSRFLSRRAATTIVTNDNLAGRVRSWNATAHVISTVPVDFPEIEKREAAGGKHVVVINTFSEDEPLKEVLTAAATLPDVTFHVTGNPKHSRNEGYGDVPSNVNLTGWISDVEYGQLLENTDIVICLTTHNHTMQRGAYEAMSLAKPLITSKWPLLQSTFYRGTQHVDNSPAEISAAVTSILDDLPAMTEEMKVLRAERQVLFDKSLDDLKRAAL